MCSLGLMSTSLGIDILGGILCILRRVSKFLVGLSKCIQRGLSKI